MSRVENLNKTLRSLQSGTPEIEAAALISEDGLMIASALPQHIEDARVAGMSSTLLSLGSRAATELERGALEQVLIRGEHGYVVMVNASAIILLHTAYMILRPVDQLVEASRELAKERFDYRVEIDRDDEFGELAHAYNRLAAQLAANEERKMETLRQVAVALNHDLNNTLAAIELELRLVDLQTGGNPRLTERFQRMHQSLARVAKAVRSLAEVRRIVLTEYMPGQMMLDLERSVSSDDAHQPPSIPAHPPPRDRKALGPPHRASLAHPPAMDRRRALPSCLAACSFS